MIFRDMTCTTETKGLKESIIMILKIISIKQIINWMSVILIYFLGQRGVRCHLNDETTMDWSEQICIQSERQNNVENYLPDMREQNPNLICSCEEMSSTTRCRHRISFDIEFAEKDTPRSHEIHITSNAPVKRTENEEFLPNECINGRSHPSNIKNEHFAEKCYPTTSKQVLPNQYDGICQNNSSEFLESTEEGMLSFLNSLFTRKRKVIVIHGPSASGKTTFARDLEVALSKRHKVFVLSMDSFYKSFTGQNISAWDFDNPGAIDWGSAHKLLRALHDEKRFLPIFMYSFINNQSSGPTFEKNTYPDIIIVEGILSLNLFSEFNFSDYSPITPSDGAITRNTNSYPNFSILKIKMNICQEKMRDARIKRDMFERGRSFDKVSRQFNFQVWPATLKFVYHPVFEADIHLVHGTFNKKGYDMLFSALTKYFLNEFMPPRPRTTYIDVIVCNARCFQEKVSGLILWDH